MEMKLDRTYIFFFNFFVFWLFVFCFKLHTQRRTQKSMPEEGFEPAILWTKRVESDHASTPWATRTGYFFYLNNIEDHVGRPQDLNPEPPECESRVLPRSHLARFTLRKDSGSIEKTALDWNPQGNKRRGRSKQTWRRTVAEEIEKEGKTWGEVKKLAQCRTRWRRFVDALCSC